MIKSTAKLSIQRVPISRILITESRPRYPAMVMLYVDQMHKNPHDDPGFARLFPSREYPGLFEMDDGHHKYLASIIEGRSDMLCVVVEKEVSDNVNPS